MKIISKYIALPIVYSVNILTFTTSNNATKMKNGNNTVKIDLPSRFATWLINGDCSGLDCTDIEQCERSTKGLGACVSCSEEEFCSKYNGLLDSMLEYTFIPKN